jgi:hypothetical protein
MSKDGCYERDIALYALTDLVIGRIHRLNMRKVDGCKRNSNAAD